MELMKQIKQEVKNGVITEYSETTARLAALKKTYGTEVPDASTKKGYDRAKQIAVEMRTLRNNLEKKRKEFKAPVLEFGKMIDSEAKRITNEIASIEEPFKSAYREVDEEKKRVKEAIDNRIIFIKDSTHRALECDSSEDIEKLINDIAELDVSKQTFAHREDEAAQLVAVTLEKLSEIHAKKVEQEQEQIRIEAERAELEKLRLEAQEREQAQREAEVKAAREAEDARIAEEAAKRAVEEEQARQKAELERLEREKQEAIEREARLIKEAEEAAERARLAEIARQEQETKRIEEEQKKREANRLHVSKIRSEAKDCLMLLDFDEAQAEKIVLAISGGQIKNVQINY